MTWDHPRGYDPQVAAAEAYAQAHPDVTITWDKRSLQRFADHPLQDLAERYDLIVVDHPHVGQVARENCLVALNETDRDADLQTLASQSLGGSHESYQYHGRQWALAIDAAAQVAAYRPDLIDAPPATWDAVIRLAEQGKVLWPIKPVDALMSFFTLAANRGTPCATESTPLIADDDGLAVLDALRALAQHMPQRCLKMNPIETLEHMAEHDDIAYCPLLYGYSNYARDGFRSNKVKFTNIPALGDNGPRGSTLGGTGIAVSAFSEHVNIAVDYALWIASADVQKGLFFDHGGQPGNRVAWHDDRLNAITDNFFLDTLETLDRSYIRPRYDGYMRLQDEGGNAVNAFLAGEVDAKSTLLTLQQLFEETRS